jgi:hypothetical protein
MSTAAVSLATSTTTITTTTITTTTSILTTSSQVTTIPDSFCALNENTLFLDFVPDIDPVISKLQNVTAFDCCKVFFNFR